MKKQNIIDLEHSPKLWALFYRVYIDRPDVLRIEQSDASKSIDFIWVSKDGDGHKVEVKGPMEPWKDGRFLAQSIELHTEGMKTVLSGEEYSYLVGGGSTVDISDLAPLWKMVEAACAINEAKRIDAATAPASANAQRRHL